MNPLHPPIPDQLAAAEGESLTIEPVVDELDERDARELIRLRKMVAGLTRASDDTREILSRLVYSFPPGLLEALPLPLLAREVEKRATAKETELSAVTLILLRLVYPVPPDPTETLIFTSPSQLAADLERQLTGTRCADVGGVCSVVVDPQVRS